MIEEELEKSIVYVSLLAVFFIISCDWEDDKKVFAYGLRGVWISNDSSIYYGQLEIEVDQITITGFNESQTPSGEDSNKRPFLIHFIKPEKMKKKITFSSPLTEDRKLCEKAIEFFIRVVKHDHINMVYVVRQFMNNDKIIFIIILTKYFNWNMVFLKCLL